MINEPTRYSNNSHTTIDLAFTNIKYCTAAGVLNYNISDHKAIYIIKKKVRNCTATEVHIGRSYRRLTSEALEQVLSRIDKNKIMQIDEPNKCWEEIEGVIMEAANKLCPVKELKIRITTVDYLTPDLLEMQRDRDKQAKKADKTRDPGDRSAAKG